MFADMDDQEAIYADGPVLVRLKGGQRAATIFGQIGAKKNKRAEQPSVMNRQFENEPFFEWLTDATKDFGATRGDRRRPYVERGTERMFSI